MPRRGGAKSIRATAGRDAPEEAVRPAHRVRKKAALRRARRALCPSWRSDAGSGRPQSRQVDRVTSRGGFHRATTAWRCAAVSLIEPAPQRGPANATLLLPPAATRLHAVVIRLVVLNLELPLHGPRLPRLYSHKTLGICPKTSLGNRLSRHSRLASVAAVSTNFPTPDSSQVDSNVDPVTRSCACAPTYPDESRPAARRSPPCRVGGTRARAFHPPSSDSASVSRRPSSSCTNAWGALRACARIAVFRWRKSRPPAVCIS
jgi:hypothetical protein